MARMILLVTVLAAAALASQAANLRTAGGANGVEWTEKKGDNVKGGEATDLGGCGLANGKDVRTNPMKVDACKQQCEKNVKCKAIVFHKWGVMLKKSKQKGKDLEFDSKGNDYTTYVKVLPPVDCVMGEWTQTDANAQPTTCSKTCGGGTQKESRKVTTPAANGGKKCGKLQKEAKCNTEACPYKKIGNFNIGGHEAPGGCSKTGDIRKKPDDMKVCFDECNAKPDCHGIVFHKWGTMMKSVTKKFGDKESDGERKGKPITPNNNYAFYAKP